MSYTVQPDYDTLPTALLPIAKAHMRIDFDDDDADITEKLAEAIGLLEQFWSLSIFEAEVTWTPGDALSLYQCPVQPVSAFGVMVDTVDVSADYALESGAPTAPVWLVKSDGTPFATDAEVTLMAGYADIASLPPPMRAGILRVAATLYEHRESVTTFSVDQMPFWLNDMLGGLWVPRA